MQQYGDLFGPVVMPPSARRRHDCVVGAPKPALHPPRPLPICATQQCRRRAWGNDWIPCWPMRGARRRCRGPSTLRRRSCFLTNTRPQYIRMKVVGVRWMKANRGIPDTPRIRCRLLAQVLTNTNEGDFARTLAVLSPRVLIPDVATSPLGLTMSTAMDVKFAFQSGGEKRKLYNGLVEQGPWHSYGSHVELRRPVHGTGDVPQVWQVEVDDDTKKLGCDGSILRPSLYMPRTRGCSFSPMPATSCVQGQKFLGRVQSVLRG